jgi:Cupin
MDAIADVLNSFRSGNATLARAVLARPWGIRGDPTRNSAIHVVLEGECWLRLAAQEAMRLSKGDVILVTSGVGHALSDLADAEVAAIGEVLRAAGEPRAASDMTTLVCAKCHVDDPGPHPMVSLMPPLIHLTRDQVEANEPLRLALELLCVESRGIQTAAGVIASRLLDSVLVLLLRAWIDNQPAGTPIGSALCAMVPWRERCV